MDMSTQQNVDEIRNIKGIRRIAVWTVVVSLVITALIGIYTIVSGEFGETQSKVMLTTLAVAAFSVLASVTSRSSNETLEPSVGLGLEQVRSRSFRRRF